MKKTKQIGEEKKIKIGKKVIIDRSLLGNWTGKIIELHFYGCYLLSWIK